MDRTDIALIQLLLMNSRHPYSELAEKLNLSVNAVHKRIQSLIESGVIRSFTAKLGPMAAPFVNVFIWGTTQLTSVQSLPERLSTQGSIYWLAVGGAKALYIGAYLKSINELTALVEYVKDTAKIPEPTVGLVASPPIHVPVETKQAKNCLCGLDYRIIESLQNNSRKPLSEVAEELGVATKTVRRRLSLMIKNYLVELSVEWYPDTSNDIITLLELHFKPNADPYLPFQIAKTQFPHVLFFWSYANIANLATFAIWTNTMKELQTIRETLEQETRISSITPNTLYVGYIFKTWRDKIPKI